MAAAVGPSPVAPQGNAGSGGDAHSDASIHAIESEAGYLLLGQIPNIWANSYGGTGGNVTSTGGGMPARVAMPPPTHPELLQR